MKYEYFNKMTRVPLSETDQNNVWIGIEADIANSTMTNKIIQGSRWDEDPGKLTIFFETELSAEDKIKLDELVAEY